MDNFPRDVRFFGAAMSPRWGAGGHARAAEICARSARFLRFLTIFKAILHYFGRKGEGRIERGKNAFGAGNTMKSGRGAPAGLIPSREAAPPAPSAEELDISVKVGLNMSNIMTRDLITVTEIVLPRLVTELVTQSRLTWPCFPYRPPKVPPESD